MTALLPPIPETDHLVRELRLVKTCDREDALQEAWVAHLKGRDSARAVNTFGVRERRYHRRQATGVLRHAR